MHRHLGCRLILVFFQRGTISLKIILVIHFFENFETLLRSHAALSVDKVDEDMVRALRNTVQGEASLFLKTASIGQLFPQVVDAVQELASLAILTETLLVELGADLGLVVTGKVRLLFELVARVSKGAGVAVMAASELLHVAAHLGLSHLDDFLVEHLTLFLRFEVSLALVRASGVDSRASQLHKVCIAVVNLDDGGAQVALEERRVRHVVLKACVILARAVLG